MRHGAKVGGQHDDVSPRRLMAAVRAGDVDAVRLLLAGGANPRIGDRRETPLHAAARRGPLALVEALIAGGALDWQTDAAGRTPLDVARRGRALERPAIIALLDRRSIADLSFRAAVDAIHAGDIEALAALLDAEPRLLRERIIGPEAYRTAPRHQYFLDPKLFWFVANNTILVERMPPNITAVAQAMIDRGVDTVDLDYTLELVMTSCAAREYGHQRALMHVLVAAGATPTDAAIVLAAAYRELDAVRALLDTGKPMSAPVAAALGASASLRNLLVTADREDVQIAFGLAVINGHVEAVKHALEAGAEVNAYLPVHSHCSALHQAAADDHVVLIELLLAHGARTDVRDTLWNGTPLGWAIYQNRAAAQAALERARS